MENSNYKNLEKVFLDLYKYDQYKEQMYFLFSDIPQKIEFVKYIHTQYIPTLRHRQKENEGLGNYGKNRMYLYQKAIDFLEEWVFENAKTYGVEIKVVNTNVKVIKNDLNKFDLKNKAPQQNKTEFKFENKFDKLEPNKVYEYFYKLVEKGYLSKEDLESFLRLAFQNRTPPKEKITFSNKHIGNITAIFYKYYTDADSPHGKQKQYAELLGEYFKGFTTQKVMNNFAKSK